MPDAKYTFLYGATVYQPPAGSFPITVCDSEGSYSPHPSLMFRGALTERLRCDDKAMLAIANSRRALKARNLRRAKYWAAQAEHWLDRRRRMFGPIG